MRLSFKPRRVRTSRAALKPFRAGERRPMLANTRKFTRENRVEVTVDARTGKTAPQVIGCREYRQRSHIVPVDQTNDSHQYPTSCSMSEDLCDTSARVRNPGIASAHRLRQTRSRNTRLAPRAAAASCLNLSLEPREGGRLQGKKLSEDTDGFPETLPEPEKTRHAGRLRTWAMHGESNGMGAIGCSCLRAGCGRAERSRSLKGTAKALESAKEVLSDLPAGAAVLA